MDEQFSFGEAYDHLIEEVQLGRFDFQSMPVIFPDTHQTYKDPVLNRLHLMATAEHEQIHDMLARQTSHGYLILLGIRFFKKLPDNQKDGNLYQQILALHAEGRLIHETYAVFGTLATSAAYQPLLSTLSPEYRAYLEEGQKMIPGPLLPYRCGRVWLYAAVLASLSPSLPVPNTEEEPALVLQQAIGQVSGCMERWSAIQSWKTNNTFQIVETIRASAKELSYTEAEWGLPIHFEAANEVLPEEAGYTAFEEKERRLLKKLVWYIGEQALDREKAPIIVEDLKLIVTHYRDLLAPAYRLEPLLTGHYNLDEQTFGLLDRLFQENIHSTLLSGPIPTVHRLARNVAALNRIAKHCLEHQFPLGIIGYIANQLGMESRRNFQQHVAFEEPLHVQWNFLSDDLSAYQRNEKLEILFSFEQEDFQDLEEEVARELSLFASPADYYELPGLRKVTEALASRGVSVYLMQPLNFLNFLEWRLERNLPIEPFVVEMVSLPGENFQLMKVWFSDHSHTYIRLVGQTTLAGVLKLYSLQQPAFSINFKEAPSLRDQRMINFLRIYWK